MKKLLLSVIAMICFLSFDLAAQAPNLPTKGTLSEAVLSSRFFSNALQADTVVKQRPIAENYTLEVVAKVNSASGRGLDIEARNASVKGFRLSLDATALKWTSSLNSSTSLTSSDAGQSQTIRIAVNNQSVHIYQNGVFVQTQALSAIKDISGGLESDNLLNTSKGPTLIANWAGTAPNNTGRPSDYGWAYTGTTVNLFNTANSGSGIRYMDISASSGSNVHMYNGSPYVGRLMFIRWDGSGYKDACFSYPVTLEANKTYDFSMLHAYVTNATGGRAITVGIGKTTAASGRIASHVFNTTGTKTFKKESFVFTSQEAGQYYLTFTGNWALYSIAELAVNKINVNPRFIFGKNYPNGSVDMEVSSVTYEEGAYAPSEVLAAPKQNVMITGNVVYMLPSFNKNFIVSGKTDFHLTGETTPLINSSVELNSEDAWLFFDNIKPSVVIANWLDKVTINGISATNNPNVRISIYKNGTVIIPNGNQISSRALQVFDQPNLAGTTRSLEVDKYHNSLGDFDNKIRSFKLSRGYMATFANNADGSGYSRVFIANDADLVIDAMPLGLDTTVSFIRVFKWDWPSKKGKAGWSPAKINSTWYYDWNIGGGPSSDYEYAIIRQNAGWPSWTDINNKKNVNHLLGFNEPDRPDQANMTVDEAFNQWPEMMKSGLRIGSPAPASPHSSWITNFLAKCDQLNYRVDYVAIHCYWGGLTPAQWYSQLKSIYDRVKRPLWITEWNNGANWTTESWPADQTAQFEKQYNDMKGILQVLDTASFVERYAIYDWVENKRAMVLGDTLTLAGKYYAANKSDFAYRSNKAYVHNWKLVAAPLSSRINSEDYFKVTLSWKDLNGELGSKYILERKVNGVDSDFLPVYEVQGYVKGSTLNYVDTVFDKATYRVKAFNLNGDQFAYSTTLDVLRDATPTPPTSLTGEVLSSSIIKLNWNAGANARSYNLKRSLNEAGPFETVYGRTTQFLYQDTSLTPSTDYYYAVTALNSAGESVNSTVLNLRTKDLVAPDSVSNPRAASGDAKVILTWDFIYDAKYDILRSETQNGTFDTIATNVNAVRYEDKDRINGKTYYYKVIAQNAAGRSTETQVLQGTPAAGQYVYINFDEAEGSFAQDAWGGYHGTLAATATRADGHTAGAMKLDGTGTSYASLNPGLLTGLNDFTISTWVKMDALSNWMRIFDFGAGTSKYMFLTPQVNVSGGKSTVRYTIKNGSGEQSVSYPFSFPLNTWMHFAISQFADTAKLYINGSFVAANKVLIKPSDLGLTNQNYLGKSQYNDPLLKGSIDEFKIFNRALSEAEIGEAMKEEQIITFNPFSEKVLGEDDFDPSATASSSLPVSYSSSDTSIATITSEGKIRLVGRGVTVITAYQSGDSTYRAAPPVIQQLSVFAPPMVLVKNAEIFLDENGNASLNPEMVDNGSVSYNGSLTLALDTTAFNCASAGTPIIVTLTAKDEKGYKSSATAEVKVVDNLKPVIGAYSNQFFCFAGETYSIPLLSVSDNCGISSVAYSINGATTRSGSGLDASGIFNTGESTINWTVTDIHGNINTAVSTVTVNLPLQAIIPDVYAIDSISTKKNTIYLGYGPTSLTIHATADGGSGSFNYLWSTGATSESIAVTAAGTYSVIVTDSKGCQTSASILIRTHDVTCGNKNDKVLICHNGNVLCVDASSVQAHLNHGDQLGTCANSVALANQSTIKKLISIEDNPKVIVYPNPATEYVYISGLGPKAYQYNLYNLGGSKVSAGVLLDGKITLPVNLAEGNYLLQVTDSGKTKISQQLIIKK